MAEHGNARHNCCRAFISRMLGDSLSETFVDFYWPVNRLHLAIYICFAVSFSYTYLWLSRFLQAQCGTYRVFGGSIANCSFEVVGFLVYTWMTFLSLKLGCFVPFVLLFHIFSMVFGVGALEIMLAFAESFWLGSWSGIMMMWMVIDASNSKSPRLALCWYYLTPWRVPTKPLCP